MTKLTPKEQDKIRAEVQKMFSGKRTISNRNLYTLSTYSPYRFEDDMTDFNNLNFYETKVKDTMINELNDDLKAKMTKYTLSNAT